MPALPTIDHPKLNGRKLVPWGRFDNKYHREEERLPFFLTAQNQVWEARLFVQRGTNEPKAELRLLGPMDFATYDRFGISPPATGPLSDRPPGPPAPPASFGNSSTTPTPTTLAAGAAGAGSPGTTSAPRTPTTPNITTGTPAAANNNTGQGTPAGTAGPTSWLDTITGAFRGIVDTVTSSINSLNIPGVNLPTQPPQIEAANNGTGNANTAGAAGNTGATAGTAGGSSSSSGKLLLVGAAAVGLYFLLRRKT